ncbi:MAG: hypothetical protein LBE71_06260 [Dysgonamonadaceae bacterium]|nr:hypothetical protein [Dysgonamonadaceae bacterium]
MKYSGQIRLTGGFNDDGRLFCLPFSFVARVIAPPYVIASREAAKQSRETLPLRHCNSWIASLRSQ